jgi:hypothetical protein
MPFGVYVYPSKSLTAAEISEADFEILRCAKINLGIVESVEEKLGILLGNYEEFETTLLSQTVHNVVFQETRRSLALDLIYTLNRRVINLLTSCKLYIDQIEHDLNSIYGRGAEVAVKVDEERRRQYDTRLGYRALEALRNYVQHRGLPIDGVQHSIAVNTTHKGIASNTLTPLLNTHKIREDGKFKAAVLEELITVYGEKVDLKPLTRDYIEGLIEVHRTFRRAVADDTRGWESTLQSAVDQQSTPDGESPLLIVVHTDEAGDILEEVHLSGSIISRRRELEQRMPLYGSLSKQVVTSEAKLSSSSVDNEDE